MLWCAQVSTDWVGLIDEWARRFFHELDYDREARSAMQFKEQMEPLGGITVAPVYTELTSGEVLTTAWVQGDHLQLETFYNHILADTGDWYRCYENAALGHYYACKLPKSVWCSREVRSSAYPAEGIYHPAKPHTALAL